MNSMTGRRFIDTNVVVYHALIVATAKLSGCVRVLSEDLTQAKITTA